MINKKDEHAQLLIFFDHKKRQLWKKNTYFSDFAFNNETFCRLMRMNNWKIN